MPDSDNRHLLVSIHDVGPAFEKQIDTLSELLCRKLGGPRFAMLVVPDHWGANPLRIDSPFASRLRRWSDSGIEMFVHGWYHRDDSQHRGSAALKARYMTASEGEFLGLPKDECSRRMTRGRDLIEDIIGCRVAGFIAPAWLYGAGAKDALKDSSYALAEDHWNVWEAATGTVLARGPVITWASRSPLRTTSSIMFAALARLALHRLKTVRVAVHPGDVTKPDILESIDRTLTSFAKRRTAGRYSDLIV